MKNKITIMIILGVLVCFFAGTNVVIPPVKADYGRGSTVVRKRASIDGSTWISDWCFGDGEEQAGDGILVSTIEVEEVNFVGWRNRWSADMVYINANINLPVPDTSIIWEDPVIDKDISSPPGGESDGDRYIVAPATNWYAPEFAYRRTITTDNTKITTDETNAVVTYQFNGVGDNIWSNAQADGDDILFTNTDGIAKLNHSLEWYDAGNERLLVQIGIPDLDADAPQAFYMYYGDATAPAQEDPTQTFPSTYALFYDMTPASASGEDQTQYRRDPYEIVGDPTSAQDDMGRYTTFDGNDGWNLRGITYFYDSYEIRSVSVIIKTSATLTGTQTIFAHGGTQNGSNIYLHHDGSGAQIWAGWWSKRNAWNGDWLTSDRVAPGVDSSGYVSASTLYYITANYNATAGLYQLWVNGVEMDVNAGHTATVAIAAVSGRGGLAYSGPQSKLYNGAGASGNYFTGDIYEFFCVDVAWTENLHDTWYNNRSDNANFWTTAAESGQTGSAGDWAGQEKNIAEYNGSGWDFTIAIDGMTTWVEDENRHYVYNGTAGTWEVLIGSDYDVLSHESLSNIQGGSYGPPVEHYHLTDTQHTEATRIANDTQTGLMPGGKLDAWDLGYIWRLIGVDTDSGAATPDDARFGIVGGAGIDTSGSGDEVTISSTATIDQGGGTGGTYGTLTGAINGANQRYDTSGTFVAANLQVYLNCVLMLPDGDDYTVVDTDSFDMVVAPLTNSVILTIY